jgi:hypothetical protein
VVVAALGAPLGWLWAAVAPDVPVQVVPGGVAPIGAQPEEFFAADGWFVLFGVVFGGLAAVAVWFLLRRQRGPVALAAVTAGAVGAGLLAWWVGHRIGLSDYREQLRASAVGTELARPPDLRAKELGWWFGFIPRVQGSLLIPAAAAAIVYTMLAAWSRYPSLRRDEPEEAWSAAEPGPGEEASPAVGPGPEEASSAPGSGDAPAPDGPEDMVAREGSRAGQDQLELGGTASSDSGTGTART